MRANHAGQARRAQAPRGLSDDTDGAVRGVEDADDHFLGTVIGAGWKPIGRKLLAASLGV